MRALWTAVALLLALAFESGLSYVLPASARVVDPFLLVLVYCGLMGGEMHGMLAGAAAGWIQDVHFGGRVLGLTGLSKVLVGFGVGLAATRFHLTEPGPRVVVLLAAGLIDILTLDGLAAAFDVRPLDLSATGMAVRLVANALLGVAVFALLERRFQRPLRRE